MSFLRIEKSRNQAAGTADEGIVARSQFVRSFENKIFRKKRVERK
jgi:hypothetical protein